MPRPRSATCWRAVSTPSATTSIPSALAIEDAKIEIGAVVDYYASYLETAEPFEFDTVTIILEGDKEKFQQLVTRPAPGLEASRNMVAFLCQIEVPNQPSISPRSFDDLEDRLLDPP